MPGRVLSQKNEQRLRDALASLKGMLAWLEGDAGEDDAGEDEKEAKEAARSLPFVSAIGADNERAIKEAANLGHYLESRIHLAFTQIADDLFGEGRINRDERIVLSHGIGEALTAFNTALTASMPALYSRSPWADAPEATEAAIQATEAALQLDTVPLAEAALRNDGTALIKLIAPGWGSSGYYSREVLERDGPKVFTAGLKQYWNHPTAAEEAQRPEGDLNALAAELISNARYDEYGPRGAGLYADAKVFAPYQEAVNELAPHIGVSIRASGKAAMGKAEGREGPIIQEITSAKSADYVTVAGAGGEIVRLFEAARQTPVQENNEMTEEQMKQAIREAVAPVAAENARLLRQLLERDANDAIAQQLSRSTLPQVAQARLLERLQGDPPLAADGSLDRVALAERVTTAISSEATYLAHVAGFGSGRIEGMGGAAAAADPALSEASRTLEESFVALGISESQAKRLATF